MNSARKGILILGLGVVGIVSLNAAQAASFDCSKARTRVEKLICHGPVISKLDSQLGKVYKADLAKADPKQKKKLVKDELNWLKSVRDRCATRACLRHVYSIRLARLKATSALRSTSANGKAANPGILGHYVAKRVPLSATVSTPIAHVCKPLVANFNQFRDVPFASNHPRISSKYPQFRHINWKPIPWNPTLAEMAYTTCPNKACLRNPKNGWKPIWNAWLKDTAPLRRAGKPLLWRARIDLLGDGRHETLIRLTHVFRPDMTPSPRPYSHYFESRIYMLPSPYPKMAKSFDKHPGFGFYLGVTNIIQNVGGKFFPYLFLEWSRDESGIGVSYFKPDAYGPSPYYLEPLCIISWIPRGK